MQQIWWNSLVCVHTGEMGEQFANQAPWSQLHRRDKWEKLERSGSADGWVKSRCQNDLWLYEVWHWLTLHTQAHPGTHTQVHRHVLKWNLCALGVRVERVQWRLVPEEVQPSFLCVSPLKIWALKGKTISFLDGVKETQGYWRFHLSVNKQKDTGGSVNSCSNPQNVHFTRSRGNPEKRTLRWCQRMMGNGDLWVTATRLPNASASGQALWLRATGVNPQIPKGAPGMDGRNPSGLPLDLELLPTSLLHLTWLWSAGGTIHRSGGACPGTVGL